VIFARTRLRLMLLNVAVMAAVIAILAAGTLLLMDRALMAQATSELQADAHRASAEAAEQDVTEFQADHTPYATGAFYVLWNTSGDPFFNPAGAPASQLRGAAVAAIAGRPSTQVLELAGDRDTLVASEPVRQGGRLTGAVQVGRSLVPVHAAEAGAIAAVATASAAALAVGVLVSWFVAGRALVPIRHALDRQREFTADASHELRTPLTVLDAGIQVLRRHPEQRIGENAEVLESMEGEARRMSRLVAGLLTLARADWGGAELQLAEVDVDQLVRSAVREAGTLAGGTGASVRLTTASAGVAMVDADRLKQLMLILLDNAIRHSPPGQPVEVSCLREDRALVLEVADRGPGIPAEHREAVFERFRRLGPGRTRPGGGLGLPIARWIVSAHGGSISLRDNRPGLRVRVVLGASRASPAPSTIFA
jgi:two-component system, OmpR family, sensor histidine kinase CiaH